MDEEVLNRMFAASTAGGAASKLSFTEEEAGRFQKAFSDPEFRKMFSEYIDELQDPKNREETEAYISQLEGEQKVPEGKELIRPIAGFVAKSFKTSEGSTIKDKIFLNIVQSDKIAEPVKTTTPKGDCWSLPYSLGPPHMEKDKKGDNAACFDCCFHPEALKMGAKFSNFKDLLVTTAIDGVEEAFKRQGLKVKVDRDFHIVKGIAYKQGQIPTMMMAKSSKDNWKTGAAKPSPSSPSSSDRRRPEPPSSSPDDASASPVSDAKKVPLPLAAVSEASSTKSAATKGTAMKKGFLNSSTSSLYPEKVPTIRPKETSSSLISEVSASDVKSKSSTDNAALSKILSDPAISSKPAAQINDSLKVVSTKMKAKTPETLSVERPPPSATISEPSNQSPVVASGPATPAVIVKHREAVSLGDFDGVKSQSVQLNRPKELIYEIQLPLVTSASKIVLDVSERRMCLTYLDTYKLDMSLPYKVYDKKGKASYDKARKCLVVTLPVEAAPLEKAETNKDFETKDSKSADLSMVTEVESNKADSTPPPAAAATTVKTKSSTTKDHSKWVNRVESNSSKELLSEINKQAEEAKKAALAASANNKAPIPPSPPVETEPRKTNDKENASLSTFIASATFAGHRKGYIFQNGPKGIGYYPDPSIRPKELPEPVAGLAASMAKVSLQEIDDSIQLPPFNTNQTVTSMALLLQVESIVPDSVKITANQYSIGIRFSALNVENNATVKVQYGITFELVSEFCIGGVDVANVRHDVAAKNMVVLLPKLQRCIWRDPTNDLDNSKWLKISAWTAQDLPASNSLSTEAAISESSTATAASTTTTEKPSSSSTSKMPSTAKNLLASLQFSTDLVSQLD